LEDLTEPFQDFEFEIEDFHDLGSGVTFNVFVQRGRPHGSDRFVASRLGVVAIWSDGRVARATSYQDVDQTRAAAERLAEGRGYAVSEEPTTPDLVELVRGAIEATNSADFDLMMSYFGPDATFDVSPMGMGTFEGLAAIRRFYEDWINTYEEFRAEAKEILDLGEGVTFALIVQRARPAGSTGFVHLRYAAVATWVDNMIVRATQYGDVDEARAAAERLAQERG
jgi:ketosteroid isomerase-like protein